MQEIDPSLDPLHLNLIILGCPNKQQFVILKAFFIVWKD